MGKVTGIEAYRQKANAPDADQVYVDDDDIEWFKFGIDYKDQRNKTMSFHIWATSLEDANKQLELIKTNACICGQIISEIE